MLQALITIVIVLIIAGLIIWLVEGFLPIDVRFKQLIRVVVIVGAVLYVIFLLLQLAGIAVR